ncbi:MAG: hypothetical protein F6K40_08655 [Okeania sp. SIO3I5]|uniref:hypothetical protein n=1 Tax=Okeania sp. SIO3I5 TaxID=2607805 RepID=UPI0013B6EC7B|nr:hypothetical protein [Okeania sp. SIO3I5]NEQ36346.1 hypothetical protein [Okeania sp. SIO3I5]
MINTYRIFNYWLAGLASSLSILVLGLNWFVNPYGITNSPKIKSVNWYKPATSDNTRLYKAVDITRQNAKTILLGASRIETGINPDYSALKPYQPVYNLGLAGGTIYEQRRYLEYAISNQPNLEMVILGIDLWLVASPYKTKAGFSEARLENKGFNFIYFWQINYSLNTLIETKDTLIENLNGKVYKYHNENGLIVSRNQYGIYAKSFTQFLPGQVNRKDFTISQLAIDNLKLIKEICQENNIKLIAFITPPHASQIEATYIAGFGNVIEQMKREIVKIMPVWDFYGYNSITTEPIDNVKNYWDSSHYSLEVGDLILNRILGYQEETVPADFGVMITPDNVESELAKMSERRKLWLVEQPETVKFLQDLKR